MSFRHTVFVALVLAVLLSAVFEGLLDVLVDDLVARHEEARSTFVEEVADRMAAGGMAVVAAGSGPLRARVLAVDGSPFGDEGFPDDTTWWLVEQRLLADGGRLEVALELGVVDRLLANRLVVDLLDVPLFLVLALVLASVLTHLVAAPVRALTRSTEARASQRAPTAIAVPAGNDELSALAESFNRLTAALRGYAERESSFTLYASHELRTPLSALRLQLDRAQLGLVAPSDVLPALDRNVTRLEELLKALLALTRFDDDDDATAELAGLVTESIATTSEEGRRRLAIMRTPAPGVRVRHPRLLQGAVANLVENALRHGRGTVELEVEASGRLVVARVRDEGPGVPAEDLRRLTEPFFRRADGGGLGLGLALVDRIAETLGGTLHLRTVERGFEATVTLPIVVVGDPEGRGAIGTGSPRDGTGGPPGRGATR
jgi:signal transduction histidine kinase